MWNLARLLILTWMQTCYSEGDYDSCLGLYLEMKEMESMLLVL